MKRLETVTVGLSLLPADASLLKYAALLAGYGIGRRFRFVHVQAKPGVEPQVARARMEDAVSAAALPAGVEASVEVLQGVRVDQMLAHVERNPCDVVLLGHRADGSGKRSLALRLAMIAPTSVWVVPDGSPAALSRVLAPIDFSSHSADSLSLACRLAQEARAECAALHVYFDESTVRYPEHIEEIRGNERRAFERFVAPLELHGVSVEPVFEDAGNVSHAILRVAQERKCDLIVMNTRGRSTAASILLGSETSQVLTDSPIPVLAVKHRGAFMNLFQVLTSRDVWSKPAPKTN